MVRIFAPICLLVSLCGTAYAAQPLALILSWGQDSCGKYVQAEKQEKQMYLSWVLGFISGANTRDTGAGRMGGHGWDEAGVTAWLQNYCTQNPLTPFVSAAEALRTALGGNPQK
jgi:hypothetical protein